MHHPGDEVSEVFTFGSGVVIYQQNNIIGEITAPLGNKSIDFSELNAIFISTITRYINRRKHSNTEPFKPERTNSSSYIYGQHLRTKHVMLSKDSRKTLLHY